MATRPLAAGLTCVFNQLIDGRGGEAEPTDAKFLEYGMAPTIFVVRQAAVDVMLGETQIQAGDSVHVFLSEFRGCPFRPGSTLPFGYARHICPGRGLSSQIMASTQAFVRQHSDDLKRTLRPSPLHPGLPTAFLVFR
jgi:cytochrome P450